MAINSSPYKDIPKGLKKLLLIHWPLVFLVCVVASFGFLMLYSVAEGDYSRWSRPQVIRFTAGIVIMVVISQITIDFWRSLAPFIYFFGIMLLFLVQFMGEIGMGARRWLEFGPIRFQPSEIMKVGVVLMFAIYYDWLKPQKVS